MSEPLPACRKCGSPPEYAAHEIVPNQMSYALFCPNPQCWNDTHWQHSITEAERLWRKNPCVDMRGGGGDPCDDMREVRS